MSPLEFNVTFKIFYLIGVSLRADSARHARSWSRSLCIHVCPRWDYHGLLGGGAPLLAPQHDRHGRRVLLGHDLDSHNLDGIANMVAPQGKMFKNIISGLTHFHFHHYKSNQDQREY